MKFLLLLYGDESQWADASPEDIQRSMDEYVEYERQLKAASVLLAGEGLEATNAASTIRVQGGETIQSDGPFAETREQLGGFYLLECRDRDEALQWASKVPAASDGGTVEIRPVMDYEAYGYEAGDAEQANA
jgi:hypothetical protein